MSARKRLQEMMQNAWEVGLDGSRIPSMTPSEVAGYYEAHKAKHKIEAANLDRLAWLVGSYCAVGVNAPKKYPRKPRNVERILKKETDKAMTDDEMKSFMFNFAARWNHGIESGNPADPV